LAIIAQGRVCIVDVTHAECDYPIDVYSFFGGVAGPWSLEVTGYRGETLSPTVVLLV